MAVKKGLLAVALVVCASPALAGSLVSTSDCRFSRFYGYSHCISTLTYVPDPVRNLEQERLDAIAQAKEDEKWDAFCRPTFKADRYGIRRASYAAKGCDVGRSE
jgi:hypothetical protein